LEIHNSEGDKELLTQLHRDSIISKMSCQVESGLSFMES